MKILVLPSWFVNTKGFFVINQSEALMQLGHEVRIIAFEYRSLKNFNIRLWLQKNQIIKKTESNGLVIFYGIYWKLPKFEKLNTILFSRKIFRSFIKIILPEFRPDVIHVHSAMWAGYVASLIKKKFKIPYVITEHRARFVNNSIFAGVLFKKWYGKFLTPAFSEASCIIPVSKLLVPKISEFLTVSKRIEPIPNLIDTDFFTPQFNKTNSEFRFIMIGFLRPVKGIDILLKAFSQLRNEIAGIHLTVIGDGEERHNLLKMKEKLNLADCVEFTGSMSREGVREKLQHASAFVLSSRAEACAQVVLEALSCGLPVVSTDIMPDDIITPENVYIVINDDVVSL